MIARGFVVGRKCSLRYTTSFSNVRMVIVDSGEAEALNVDSDEFSYLNFVVCGFDFERTVP